MDRAYIGSVVFGDKAKKAQLEAILFPLIHAGIDGEIKKIEENKKNPVIFLDMPLLYEVKYDSYVDETWLVYVDPVTQLTRLMKRELLHTKMKHWHGFMHSFLSTTNGLWHRSSSTIPALRKRRRNRYSSHGRP